jgi:hypothetical protein
MKLAKLHLALFYSGINLNNKLQIANQIIEKNSEFDGEPLILPVPDDAPSEVPRIILKNSDESIQIIISKIRTDFSIKQDTDFTDFSTIADKYIKIIDNINKIINPTLTRLGLVVEILDHKENVINYISETYLKEKKENEEINLSIRDNHIIDDKKINIWFRIKNNIENSDKDNITYIFDVNSSNDENYSFSDCKTFFNKVKDFILEKNSNYIL